MSARPPANGFDEIARKWRALAERRRAHFLELYHSGRWKHYYSEERFLRHLREAVKASERWAEIAPSLDAVAAERVEPRADTSHATAA